MVTLLSLAHLYHFAYSDKNEQLFQIVNFDEKYTDSDNLNTDSDNLNRAIAYSEKYTDSNQFDTE